MGIFWKACFLCDEKGQLSIGDNFNKFHKEKTEPCPFCRGSGRVPIKISYSDSYKNRLGGNK